MPIGMAGGEVATLAASLVGRRSDSIDTSAAVM